MASASAAASLQLGVFLVLMVPASTKLEHTGTRQEQMFPSDDLMLSDNLIVPASSNPDCPDVDDVGCTEVQSRGGSDALIYPTSVHSTAKPSFSTRRHAEPPYYTHTAPTHSLHGRDPPCLDDEDCLDNSGDESASSSSSRNGKRQPEDDYVSRRSTAMTSSESRHFDGDDDDDDGRRRPPYVDGAEDAGAAKEPEGDLKRNQTHGINPLPEDKEITSEWGSTPPIGGSTGSGGRSYSNLRDHYQLAIHMNIILIVGIAVGIVILLLILIVAVCKYKGQGSKSPPIGKTDRAKSYTYEACNTLPPVSLPPGDPDAVKSRSSTSIAVGMPAAPAAAVTTTTITTTASPAASHSKPARKGVKEWYV